MFGGQGIRHQRPDIMAHQIDLFPAKLLNQLENVVSESLLVIATFRRVRVA